MIFGRKDYVIATPGFVVDPESVSLNTGRQINWDAVAAGTGANQYGTAGSKSIPAGTVVSSLGGKVVPRGSSDKTVTAAVAANVVTVTSTAHGLAIGDTVTISGATPAGLNGTFTVASVPTDDTFTYAATAVNGAATGTIKMGGEALGILVTSAQEDSLSDSLTGYGVYVGGVFYSNMLPDNAHASWATFLAELGPLFVFETYQDVRA